MFYTQSENYCTTQGKHSGFRVKGSEPCGSEMIHNEGKEVKYDMMISSMLIVVVSQCIHGC